MAFTQTHQPCSTCGSSDALSVNDDGSTYCFACTSFKQGTKTRTTRTTVTDNNFIQGGQYNSIARRHLSLETCRKWGYQIATVDGQNVQVANYRSRDGQLVGQKIRYADKSFKVRGELLGLYGQHLWKDGGPRVIVTEGEIDALSVSQAWGNKWAVVSIPHGAGSAKKHVAQALDWLERFDSVIFMFDMDDAGRKGAADCAQLITPGKAKIAELPLKDPNDLLVEGRSADIVQATFNAREYRPDGIVGREELWNVLSEETHTSSVPYPYTALNGMTHGLRLGELVTVCAGSGIGKSLFCREIAYHLLMQGETVGYIALEESVRRTALGILGLHMGKPLHLESKLDLDELAEPFGQTIGNGNFFTYDHWGSCDSDNLLSKVRYLCKGMGCSWIFLDHLSIVVSGFAGDDERRLIDNTMTKLRSLVEQTGCGMVVVSHLKRPAGVGHEEGATTSLAHLRGSAAIAQLSDIVVGMERNQQAEESANQTRIRVLKNRFTGETGLAGELYYDNDTGRLNETDTTALKSGTDITVDNAPF